MAYSRNCTEPPDAHNGLKSWESTEENLYSRDTNFQYKLISWDCTPEVTQNYATNFFTLRQQQNCIYL